jgi:hypothetical protein
MNSAYKLTELAQARAGMVVGADLLDPHGQLLLPEGAVLTDVSIASLGRHGVAMLPIRQAAEAAAGPDAGAVQARVDHLFRKNDPDDSADWATGILRRYIEDYRLGREVQP